MVITVNIYIKTHSNIKNLIIIVIKIIITKINNMTKTIIENNKVNHKF